MFNTRDVWMVFKGAKLAVVEDDRGVEHRMAECQLVLDPFPLELARELGEDVASFFYTEAGALRRELNTITLDPRVPNQMMTVRGAEGAPGSAIRVVEVLALTVSRQTDEKTGREWLKAVIRCRFDFAPRVHREWIGMYFGLGGLFSFDLEQLELSDVTIGHDLVSGLRQTLSGDSDAITMTVSDGKGRRKGVKITKDTVEDVDQPEASA